MLVIEKKRRGGNCNLVREKRPENKRRVREGRREENRGEQGRGETYNLVREKRSENKIDRRGETCNSGGEGRSGW